MQNTINETIMNDNQQQIFELIKAERARQDQTYGEENRANSNYKWLTILTEELGEVAMSINDGEPTDILVGELTQVAAVCVQWIEKLKA